MEKAVLKTLIYADIFNYPMKAWEIHKWLINKSASLRQVEETLKRLAKKSRISSKKGYYFLGNRKGLVPKRLMNIQKSSKYLRQAYLVARILKFIPSIKLVGISGGLAVENIGDDGDIDLFIITAKNRLWISRLLMLSLLSIIPLRRKASESKRKAAGKFCLNMILEEDQLQQEKNDLFVAHEILQMKVLWDRGGIYHKFLIDNEWAFKYLPNWIGQKSEVFKLKALKSNSAENLPLGFLEQLAKKFQLWYMKPPKGDERVQEGAVYFHPHDYGIEVLSRFKHQLLQLHS